MAQDEATLEAHLELRDELVHELAQKTRRQRQEASQALLALAREDPEVVAEVADVLVEMVSVPEAQTRWQCLEALSEVALIQPDKTFGAFAGAEESLFDDGSASVRLAAFRYLSRYGATSPERSIEAWPLMNEAVQCFHGDSEYRDMLICLREFAHGSIADEVRTQLVDRMSFDAKNGKGFIKAYSAEIMSVAKEG